jgi:hypothetical protein
MPGIFYSAIHMAKIVYLIFTSCATLAASQERKIFLKYITLMLVLRAKASLGSKAFTDPWICLVRPVKDSGQTVSKLQITDNITKDVSDGRSEQS